jgi:hypothetical protein
MGENVRSNSECGEEENSHGGHGGCRGLNDCQSGALGGCRTFGVTVRVPSSTANFPVSSVREKFLYSSRRRTYNSAYLCSKRPRNFSSLFSVTTTARWRKAFVGRITGCLRHSTKTVHVCRVCTVGNAEEKARLAMYPITRIDAAQDVIKVSGRFRSYFNFSRIRGAQFYFSLRRMLLKE